LRSNIAKQAHVLTHKMINNSQTSSHPYTQDDKQAPLVYTDI